ncbi:hypothetical protein, partial [Bradyrhizobium sp. dw_411]|uniref:hypothetical protein n=1 Tax=Bradyrhizobium sp. dw_411 TaxID=2720082 RepID=UPI001BCAD98D
SALPDSGGERAHRHSRDNTAHLVMMARSCAASFLGMIASSHEIKFSQTLQDKVGISPRRITKRDSDPRYA